MNISEMIQALKEAQDSAPKPFDTPAEVLRIEGDTAWVQIPGSDDETPVNLTIAAKEGDTVQVRVSGGTAFLVGNATAPPTDDTEAYVAQARAEEVQADLNEQKEYFWHDDDGAHIQGNLSGYRNDLRSDGMHIVEVETGQDVAMFTADGSRIGDTSKTYTSFDDNSFSIEEYYYGEIFFAGNLKDSSGHAKVTDKYVGNGVKNSFGLTYSWVSVISVTINGVETAYTWVDPPQPWMPRTNIKFSSVPTDGDVIVITYTTSQDIRILTFGKRATDSPVSDLSVAFGNLVEASGTWSQAFGCGTIAASNYQLAIGYYNVPDYEHKYVLIAGDGTSNNRKNVFAVRRDGTVDTAKGQLTAQATTTTWTAPTASGATKTAGGYYTEGKHVYVSISCTLNSAASSGDNVTLFTGLTAPLFMVPLEVMVANQRNGVAWINDSGELHFRPSASVSTSNAVIINGHYTSA